MAHANVHALLECSCSREAVGADFSRASVLSVRILALLRSCLQCEASWRVTLCDGMFPYQLGAIPESLRAAVAKNNKHGACRSMRRLHSPHAQSLPVSCWPVLRRGRVCGGCPLCQCPSPRIPTLNSLAAAAAMQELGGCSEADVDKAHARFFGALSANGPRHAAAKVLVQRTAHPANYKLQYIAGDVLQACEAAPLAAQPEDADSNAPCTLHVLWADVPAEGDAAAAFLRSGAEGLLETRAAATLQQALAKRPGAAATWAAAGHALLWVNTSPRGEAGAQATPGQAALAAALQQALPRCAVVSSEALLLKSAAELWQVCAPACSRAACTAAARGSVLTPHRASQCLQELLPAAFQRSADAAARCAALERVWPRIAAESVALQLRVVREADHPGAGESPVSRGQPEGARYDELTAKRRPAAAVPPSCAPPCRRSCCGITAPSLTACCCAGSTRRARRIQARWRRPASGRLRSARRRRRPPRCASRASSAPFALCCIAVAPSCAHSPGPQPPNLQPFHPLPFQGADEASGSAGVPAWRPPQADVPRQDPGALPPGPPRPGCGRHRRRGHQRTWPQGLQPAAAATACP